VANLGSEQLLSLVQQALNEIDDRPVDVTVRRVARIASLLGETVLAVYLGLELKTTGGHPPTNAENTRRLMADPSLWGDPHSPDAQAMDIYLKSRRVSSDSGEEKVSAHSLAEVEVWLATLSTEPDILNSSDLMQIRQSMLNIREQARHTAFAALCAWERQLTYANVNEQTFERFRSRVDGMLAKGAPALLDQFSAVYRRLREATRNPAAPVAEDLAQAVTTCRRILKAVADHLLPGTAGTTTAAGNPLNDAAYRNRIYEFIKLNVASDATAENVQAALGGIYNRFSALDRLASKGVHADLGLQKAELCAIGTYLVAGELLALDKSAVADAACEMPQ
jgi:hypothetical protein